jgi:type 1 fimbriae regulatory protein FimB/type 1 fimbriae regulatory protein FimE
LENALKSLAKPHLRLVDPSTDFGPVPKTKGPRPPRKPHNANRRSREYLTEAEVEKLCTLAKASNRNGHRDYTMLLIGYRHGLRTAELVDLRWDAVNFDDATLAVRRVKEGNPSTHDLMGRELRALRQLRREQKNSSSQHVFTSQHGAPFTCRGFRRMIERLSAKANLGFPIHAHMLRHGCGYKLANDGMDTRRLQAFLGHRNIQNTVRYAALSPAPFRKLWRD